jgi:hypothetical protein
MAGKALNDQQIRAKLEALDALTQSGLGIQAFAQSQGLNYLQLRAWQSHAARWRARLAGQPPSPAQHSAHQFVQLQVQPPQPAQYPSPGATADTAPPIRIECTRGSRSATLHWPTNAPVQCAQWLSAYLA